MLAIAAWIGLLFCRLLVGMNMRGLAPGVCFGGDTTTVGYTTLFFTVAVGVLISGFGYHLLTDSSMIMMVLALTLVAVGSASIINFIG
jgi:hypothetical protein